jgi:glycosyltransferase involved in cell wall biosynthesis
MERGDLLYLQNVPIRDLRALYQNAAATVCPSLAEGFDYSGVEAMASGGVVVASDIPVHREVYGETALYFNPYCEEDASKALSTVLSEQHGRISEHMREAAWRLASLYRAEQILPKWSAFLQSLRNAPEESACLI